MKKVNQNTKIQIAGVGGQGIVYLTNIIVEAAMLAEIPVSVSEIHGLSQRGGIVSAGIGLGEYCTGFTGNANVDFLIGLETLETQRCLSNLHKKSTVIFGDYRVHPYTVNAQITPYPDVNSFVEYIESQCRKVVFIKSFPENTELILYNIFLLGIATGMKEFPLKDTQIEQAIKNIVKDTQQAKTLNAFYAGLVYELLNKKVN